MINQVLDRLTYVRKNSKGWQARCPAHKDSSPSLTITEGNKGILIHCHAGCSITDVCNAMGIKKRDLFYKEMTLTSRPTPLDDYIIEIARLDLKSGKTLSSEDEQLYISAVRRRLWQ